MTQVIEKKKTLGKRECARIYKEAHQAGLEAGKAVKTKPYLVGTAVGLSDEIDYSKKTYVLDDLCGFAYVEISPARGAFVTYLKNHNIGYKGYYGGYQVSVREFGQSITRKEAYARAFAEVLKQYGINAGYSSRLD